MLRIPAPGRIEDRTVDGSCNPYLAAAAVLASGLDGIANDLDAGRAELREPLQLLYEELTARGLRSLPANLLEAVGELEQDDVLRAALGRTRATRTTSTTTPASSATSGSATTSRSARGRCAST